MLDKSYTWNRFKAPSRRVIKVNLGHVPQLDPESEDDNRGMRIAIALAVLAHVAMFIVVLPKGREPVYKIGSKTKAYVVKQVRFEPPPPQAAQQIPKPKEKRRVVPVPDTTPEEPEPIRLAEMDAPVYDPNSEDVIYGIPDAPPGPGVAGAGPMRLTGDITPPQKIVYPQPRYTEEGRLQRIQGVVILEAVIDAMGNVGAVKVLKGLPMGLTETAVEAAQQWKFKPATLDGEPVAVFLNLTIRFSLQ
jgi:protein TonB